MNINTKKVQDYGEDAFPILNSRYKILKKIGAGSFGKVFMAEDLTTHNKVAIKQDRTSAMIKVIQTSHVLSGNLQASRENAQATGNTKRNCLRTERIRDSSPASRA